MGKSGSEDNDHGVRKEVWMEEDLRRRGNLEESSKSLSPEGTEVKAR